METMAPTLRDPPAGPDPDWRLLEYERRRRLLAGRFDDLLRGSRARCARALGIPASQVSAVLRGSYVSDLQIDRLEEWVGGEEPADA